MADPVNEATNQPAIKLRHLPLLFIKSALISTLTYSGAAVMIVAALAFSLPHGRSDGGSWQSITQWSLTGIGLLAGLTGGVIMGGLSSLKKMLRKIEDDLRSYFHRAPPGSAEEESAHPSLNEGRAHYTMLLDQALAKTIGFLPLPGFLDRLIRTNMQDAIVSDFISSLEQRGLSSIGPQEFRNWLLTNGLSLGLQPVYDQLSFWQSVMIALFSILVIGLLSVTYLTP
jgi:hypothetical protein